MKRFLILFVLFFLLLSNTVFSSNVPVPYSSIVTVASSTQEDKTIPIPIFNFGFPQPYDLGAWPENVDPSIIQEVLYLIQTQSLYGNKIDYNKLLAGAVQGMLQSLDQWSRFEMPEKAAESSMGIQGELIGIGAILENSSDSIIVTSTIEGSPAEKSGIKSGDVILKVEKESLSGLSLEEAVKKIRGPVGSIVNLKVRRKGIRSDLYFAVTRAIIEIKSVKLEMKKFNGLNIAVISLFHFDLKTQDQFAEVCSQSIKLKADAVVLDIRNNLGGMLSSVTDICCQLVGKKSVIYRLEYRDALLQASNKEDREPVLGDMPVVCLVNEYSASASEVMAAFLRDAMKIKLIGKKTYGKGVVQNLIDLKSGRGRAIITISRWLPPTSDCIDKVGIVPDIFINMTEEDLKAKKDPQMDGAFAELETMIKKVK